MSQAIDKLDITVSDDVLDDLRERLARTRWPDQIPNSAWEYGTDLAYLQELCEYWREKFDWRKQEALLQQWDHFKTDIDGQNVHFLHARSSIEGALPLVITHGWPGSVFEFYKIIGPLTDPEAHAGDPADAFHVVCPSMPGYGWSGPTHETGYDIRKVAETVSKLMARLGYERYGAQGGDWGAIATTQLGLLDAEHLVGIHLNMVIAGPPAGVENPMEGVSPEEIEAMAGMGNFQKNETGYQQIQGTKPQTLGYGLTDSPAGLAGWIIEKFRTWSDCGGDIESRFSKDELLTNIMIYWVTGTINSSTRLYCESMRSGRFGLPDGRIDVPTGCAIFPKEIIRPPRKWAEAQYDVRQWSVMDAGGHFAALEEPDALVADVRSFFRELR
ncbi:MAG: epoxide hydrolase [Myxococcales bacterium]|nr:epoxide hydrolase [Myxococcales bacterium]